MLAKALTELMSYADNQSCATVHVCSVASQSYMQSLLRGVVADVGYVDRDSDTHLERWNPCSCYIGKLAV